ncbi:MAG TPA: hypothetical protein EYN66_05685 [Myxococcales bacterium]|nr:hypothetical protein [Myxococcales bacterium]
MASKFAYRYRKPVASVGVGVRTSATEDDSTVAVITAGAGVPAATEPNGSLYLRTDATDGDDAVYARVAGAWVAIKGQTA